MPVTRAGPEILVNTATLGDQLAPQTTALSNGGFVLTDRSQGAAAAALNWPQRIAAAARRPRT